MKLSLSFEFERALFDDLKSLAAFLRWGLKNGVEGSVIYDGSIIHFYRLPAARLREIKSVFDDVGMPIAAFNALRKNLFTLETMEAETRRLYHCLEACDIFKPEIFDVSCNIAWPYGLDPIATAGRPIFRGESAPPELYGRAAEILKPFTKELAKRNMQLSVELHDDGIQCTADGCLKLMNMIDEPNVGVNPDLGNWYRVPYMHHDSWRDQVVKMAPYTNYWEIKNYKRVIVPSDNRAYSWLTAVDDGDIDFREAAVILWKAGFRGWACCEGDGTGDFKRFTLKFVNYMRWVLDEWIPEVVAE